MTTLYPLRSLPFRICRGLKNRIRGRLFFEQWILLLAPRTGRGLPRWRDHKAIIPPADRSWMDPFPWSEEGRHYIFAEELPFAANRGRIVCLVLDRQWNVVENMVVLERPYHLSYPSLFEYEARLYMIPETRQNRNIELYRCTRFPDSWEFERNLMEDVSAVDATLMQRDGIWWMFANMRAQSGSTCEELHLFSSREPLSGEWKPHGLNPVVRDLRGSRPAGRVYEDDGELIRPAQDCGPRYGYAVCVNRITRIDDDDYQEERVAILSPPNRRILGIHTFNRVEDFTVVDALWRRPRHWQGQPIQG